MSWLNVAKDLDISLVIAERRGHDSKILDVCEQSPMFQRLVKEQGLDTHTLVFDTRTPYPENPVDDGSLDGLDWVLAFDGTRCLHVWLTTEELAMKIDDEKKETETVDAMTPKKSKKRKKPSFPSVRPLPLLLRESSALLGSPTRTNAMRFCASIVGESVYHNMSPTSQGTFLYFPLGGTEYISDSLWEQLGYSKVSNPVFPPHKPESWMHLIETKSLERAIANLQELEATRGAVPYDLMVTYASVSDTTASVQLRCQGTPILWSQNNKVLALIGGHTDVSFQNYDRLSKISFIGKISHEIRTPLNAICGSLDILSAHMTTAPTDLRESWDVLHAATRQVQTVVDDILDFSALSAGKLRLRKSSFSLHRLLEDVARMHASNAKTKNIHVTVVMPTPPTSFPSDIIADRGRLEQVVSNVLSNALKFTPEDGSVTIKVTRDSSTSSSNNSCTGSHNSSEASADDTVPFTIDVIDTGVGIPRSDWEAIFEDFEQARASDAIIGTGLGLAICSMLVGLHGGRIFVHSSTPHQGTTIRIQLDTPVGTSPEVTPAATTPGAIRIGRALVVDDLKTNRVVLSNLIKRIDPNAGITCAENGQHAVTLVRDQTFDIIFMDVHMPVHDSAEINLPFLSSATYFFTYFFIFWFSLIFFQFISFQNN